SATLGGATFSLTEDGRVTAEPGTYYLSANGNAVPCYDTGSEIPDADCSGTLIVEVSKNHKTVHLPAADLTKTYGVEGEYPVWTDGTLSVTFDSLGRAATADVGEYPLSKDYTVKLNGVDRTSFYEITAKLEDSEAAAVYTVLQKEIAVDYDEVDEVRFNDYLLSDGESVTTRVVAGANGDVLTAYFRLKEAQEGALAVGSGYEIEFWRYEVKPSEGDVIPEDPNYTVSVSYTMSTVKAKAGTVIVYQNENLIAERQGDARYLYLPLSTFTYTYFDLVYTDLGEAMLENESLYPSVTFYTGVVGKVRFSVEGVSEGTIPVGTHRIELLDYECSDIEDLSFENVSLQVLPFVIDEPYEGEDEAEITVSNSFEKVVTRTYRDTEYRFVLSADLTGKKVGDLLAYASMVSETDPNVLIEYDAARVSVVKRHTGVSLVADAEKSVAYGKEIGELARPYLEESVLEEECEHVGYRYRSSGSSVFFSGLPTAVGSYVVKCELLSDLYEVDPVEVELTVTKRQVAVLYHVSTSHKIYGTTFAYRTNDKTVQIKEVYPVEAGVVDTENKISDFKASDFSGVLLSSEGCAANADVGTYEFVTSGASSPHFEIVKSYVYDVAAGAEVNRFTVDRAPAPPAPDPTIEVTSKQEIKVRADGPIVVQIANNRDLRSPTENRGEGTITFSKVGGKKPLYGETFYVRVRAEAGDNYETASGWSEVKSVSVPFVSPAVTVSVLTSSGAEFTYTELTNAVEGYRIQYRVGTSGDWKNAEEEAEWTIKVDGLRADKAYTVQFRAEKGGVVGTPASVDFRTLRAPVAAEKVAVEYDRSTGKLTVNADKVEGNEGLEYCLCKPSGEEITAWSATPDFEEVLKDSNYLLKVRYAENDDEDLLCSEETVITIDTHKPKVPVTWRSILSDWFLAIVGGVLLILMIVFIVRFAKTKKKIDREEA
ncbi:MAG: fibronectin type III domain-containing protein, partial [Clostridia bacterium]|nr:fibronectin type III domain-containing protein [Clostridia bacterium]